MSFSSTRGPFSSGEDNLPADKDLVLQAQGGEETAFEELYKRYSNRIYSYLLYMVGDDGVGCELTQETFVKAWLALPNLRNASTFAGWLYRIATNSALDHLRRRRHIQCESYDEYPRIIQDVGIVGPEEQVEAEELLRMALAQVTWTYRACLIFYHIEGFPKEKIAKLLEIKESSVNTYISYGLEELRQGYARLSDKHNASGRGMQDQ